MSEKTGISWTNSTWNPVVGCTRVSAGCDNCYAVRSTRRLAGRLPLYQGLVNPGKGHFNGTVRTAPERLNQPMRWKRPRRIFVNSMSDLFHEGVPFGFIAAVFGVMWYARQHTFQILTKRPERAMAFFRWVSRMIGENMTTGERESVEVDALAGCQIEAGKHGVNFAPFDPTILRHTWPLPNVWIGTSVEDQSVLEERMTALMLIPAEVRFLSVEPLIGPVNLGLLGTLPREHFPGYQLAADRIHWVIVGGESGPGHRPIEADWVRSVRDECQDARVPFFFKQWGGRTAKAGGRELDGRVHDSWPSQGD